MISLILILLIAALHLWFMALEMVYWTRPLGLKTFGNTPEFAEASAKLAMNMGLYNGFLAAGLVWAALTVEPAIALFFLTCVLVAGLFGAWSVSRRILWVQALPAALALAALWLGW